MAGYVRPTMTNRVRQRPAAATAALYSALAILLAIGAGQSRAQSEDAGSAVTPSAPRDNEAQGGNPPAENLTTRPLEDGPVVPTGQDELIADMLGRGATLPGGCQLEAGDVNGSVIRSTYTCPSGNVVFELRHPTKAPPGALRTDQFAITVHAGSPPAGLQDALASLIRTREAKFKWLILSGPARPPVPITLILIGGIVLLALAAWVLRRRAGQRAAA